MPKGPSFLRNLHTVFIVAVSIYIPTNSARMFAFLHILSSIYFCRPFVDGQSHLCEVISHCSFDLHCSNNAEKAMAPHSSTFA